MQDTWNDFQGNTCRCIFPVQVLFSSALPLRLRASAVKVCYFREAKMRSRIDSIEPTPATFTYFGAPGTPLFAQLE